jgi:hypothetical protein
VQPVIEPHHNAGGSCLDSLCCRHSGKPGGKNGETGRDALHSVLYDT